MTAPTLASITLGVADLERGVGFWRDVVGLPLLFTSPEHHYARFDAGGGLFLGLGAGEPNLEAPQPKQIGLSLKVPDLAAAHAAMSAKGCDFPEPPRTQPWGAKTALFADPDGNRVYLEEG